MIVGAGGLGCPVGIYLAAAGIGRIGVMDYDVVEKSNLHRQVQHPMRNIGKQKAISLCEQLTQLNDCIQVEPIEALLTSANALALLSNYDIIVDASDNMATRYLLNDAAVLLDKPLISGSALRWEGHLTVYNYKSSLLEGPCYRCLFPQPPHPSVVTNCNDGGILGAITGLIGSLQALETIMVILKKPNYAQKIFIFDNGQTRTVTLRNKQVDCEACGVGSELRGNGLKKDYDLFCGSGPNDTPKVVRLLHPEDRISPEKYYEKFNNIPHILVDVRPPMQYRITHLPNSISNDE